MPYTSNFNTLFSVSISNRRENRRLSPLAGLRRLKSGANGCDENTTPVCTISKRSTIANTVANNSMSGRTTGDKSKLVAVSNAEFESVSMLPLTRASWDDRETTLPNWPPSIQAYPSSAANPVRNPRSVPRATTPFSRDFSSLCAVGCSDLS